MWGEVTGVGSVEGGVGKCVGCKGRGDVGSVMMDGEVRWGVGGGVGKCVGV